MFLDLPPRDRACIAFGGNQKGRIVRIGKFHFSYIDNVLYLERLRHDLLIINQSYDIGYNVSFNKDKCYKIDMAELTNQSVTCLLNKKHQFNCVRRDDHDGCCLICWQRSKPSLNDSMFCGYSHETMGVWS